MTYIEYLQNGAVFDGTRSGGWTIPLNYHPSTTNDVKMVVKAENFGWDGFLFVGSVEGEGNFFRFFSYEEGYVVFDCPADSDARIEVSVVSGPNEFEMGADSYGNYYLTNLTTQVTHTGTSMHNRSFQGDFYVYDDGNGGSTFEGQKIYYIEIYENGVKVKDYRPVIDNYNEVCFYETIGGTYHRCGKTLTAGPSLSSISVSPSKTVIANTGDTISIEVMTENAWTISSTSGNWLTFSSTGDTSGATITATAPSYSGATNREEWITFTDTDTTDEVVLRLMQKKVQVGQPLYLGGNEITELFLGLDGINEAYLGDVLVFSSGPFMGLKVRPTEVSFNSSSLSGETTVKASEPWSITSAPAWVTYSPSTGDSGETIVTFTTTALTAATTGTVEFVSANYSASVVTAYREVEFIEGVRSSTAPFWDLNNYLNTGIYVTGDDDTKVRIKYYGGGEFSDRIVGFDATECGSDDEDFRYFPTMADAGSGRIDDLYGWYNTNQYYDIEFGNLYVYDNLNSYMVADIGTYYGINTATTIRVDMSVNWIKEVVITRNINSTWTDVADFKAAQMGNDYGLYDTVSNTFLTKNDLTGITVAPQ